MVRKQTLKDEIEGLIQNHGMKKILEELWANVCNTRLQILKDDPTEDTGYLCVLAVNLKRSLVNYQNRHEDDEND